MGAVPRRAGLLIVLAAAVAGCGDDTPVRLPEKAADNATTTYRGRTSQGERLTLKAKGTALATLLFQLTCGDGSQTQATVTTRPRSPRIESDGSFYWSETGRAEFKGYGEGRYRPAFAGQLQGAKGSGSGSFRISFQSTNCRGNTRWSANKG